jgi:hypothetical protein
MRAYDNELINLKGLSKARPSSVLVFVSYAPLQAEPLLRQHKTHKQVEDPQLDGTPDALTSG